ncbi:MAG: PhnD/SsuA/transferrin family substrate-binding protein [Acholeplasmataceae bacterium]|nr:PhnD/SsuA/transferrin family substrate-binding protein [Acholeplasmataceae bacterium]
MFKRLTLVVLTLFVVVSLAACSGKEVEKTDLSVFFVPSRDNATLVQGISYLPELLKAELSELGYDFETVSVYVGTSYEAVGQALDAGTADIGFIPGGTYAVYADGSNMDVALTATRGGLNKDSANPKDWNDGLPTTSDPNYQVTYYRSLGIAGTSDKGRELAEKINNGGQITWEDLQDVKIGVQSVTSSSGRVYPSLLFAKLYDGKTLNDLPTTNVIQLAGYGAAAAALASGQVDIAFGYADFRRDYATLWTSTEEGGYSRTESIWAETDVVYVSDGVYNDTITVSKKTVDADLQAAIEQAFINLVSDSTPLAKPSGIFEMVKDIFKVYSHEGYQIADDSDYDGAREADKLVNG